MLFVDLEEAVLVLVVEALDEEAVLLVLELGLVDEVEGLADDFQVLGLVLVLRERLEVLLALQFSEDDLLALRHSLGPVAPLAVERDRVRAQQLVEEVHGDSP